jgi:23S rRNA (guanosine2251-2'-O)-methyltransferase
MRPDERETILYGLNPIFETLRAGRRTVYRAALNETSASQPRLRKLAALFEERGIPVTWTDKGKLADLCGSRDHQGAIIACSPYPYEAFEALLSEHRLVLLDNIEDPHNIGAILRTCEVLGYRAVCLPQSGSPRVYPSVVKVSAGASEHLRIACDRKANQYVRSARESGYSVLSLDGKGPVTLADCARDLPPRTLLVIGGEDRSVGQYILNESDRIVRIEQSGLVNSLNSSVAAAIALYALRGSESGR